MKKVIRNIVLGIILGLAMMTFSLLFVLLFVQDVSEILTRENMIRNIWCGALVGVSFYLPSLIYEQEKLPRSIQTIIHMGIGFIVYFIVAIYAQWIPTTAGPWAIVGFVVFGILGALTIWFAFYLYYKNEATRINQKLSKK
jgi:hypothetical protein